MSPHIQSHLCLCFKSSDASRSHLVSASPARYITHILPVCRVFVGLISCWSSRSHEVMWWRYPIYRNHLRTIPCRWHPISLNNPINLSRWHPILCPTFSCRLKLVSPDVYSNSFASLVSSDNRYLSYLVWVPYYYYGQYDSKIQQLILRRLVAHASESSPNVSCAFRVIAM